MEDEIYIISKNVKKRESGVDINNLKDQNQKHKGCQTSKFEIEQISEYAKGLKDNIIILKEENELLELKYIDFSERMTDMYKQKDEEVMHLRDQLIEIGQRNPLIIQQIKANPRSKVKAMANQYFSLVEKNENLRNKKRLNENRRTKVPWKRTRGSISSNTSSPVKIRTITPLDHVREMRKDIFKIKEVEKQERIQKRVDQKVQTTVELNEMGVIQDLVEKIRLLETEKFELKKNNGLIIEKLVKTESVFIDIKSQNDYLKKKVSSLSNKGDQIETLNKKIKALTKELANERSFVQKSILRRKKRAPVQVRTFGRNRKDVKKWQKKKNKLPLIQPKSLKRNISKKEILRLPKIGSNQNIQIKETGPIETKRGTERLDRNEFNHMYYIKDPIEIANLTRKEKRRRGNQINLNFSELNNRRRSKYPPYRQKHRIRKGRNVIKNNFDISVNFVNKMIY